MKMIMPFTMISHQGTTYRKTTKLEEEARFGTWRHFIKTNYL